MALPKRQHSKQRSRKRRTHWKLKTPAFSACPNCHKPILSHRVCPFCGHYKGQAIIEIKPKKEKKKRS